MTLLCAECPKESKREGVCHTVGKELSEGRTEEAQAARQEGGTPGTVRFRAGTERTTWWGTGKRGSRQVGRARSWPDRRPDRAVEGILSAVQSPGLERLSKAVL